MQSKLVLTSSPLHPILESLGKTAGAKYEDPDFPANEKSLGEVAFCDGAKHEVAWLRPQEFKGLDHPVCGLFADGLEPDDIEQGLLSDGPFCAALMVLAECSVRIRSLFARNVDNDCGAYCVSMFCDGELRHIVVDDRVPCDATTKKPLFSHCKRGEIWLPIVEKAYAKIHGSYAAIQNGDPSVALADLTGAPVYRRPTAPALSSPQEEATLWDVIVRHDRLDHVMCCVANSTIPKETGIVAGQWYGLLEARTYNGDKLVKIRNTKSRLLGGSDWTGRWGNADDEHWTTQACDDLYHARATDGTFWMTFQDWVAHFDTLVISDVEAGWDFVSTSLKVDAGTHIVATVESRHDTIAAFTVRQECAESECVPLRMCVVAVERPYLPVGGTDIMFIARKALSTPMMHVIPGKYFVLVQAEEGKNVPHPVRLASYSPSMGFTFSNSIADDEDVKRASPEVGFVLPSNYENSPLHSCALCGAPFSHDCTVELHGRRFHPWCKLCFTCGCELGDDAVPLKKGGVQESRLYCKRCSERTDLRTQKGETIRSEVQKRKALLDAEPPAQSLPDLPASEPAPLIDPVTKERTLDVLALSKERMKKAYHLRSKISDADVRAVFHIADRNGSGAIDSAEMAGLLQSSGMCLSSIPAIQKFQVKTVMEEADKGEQAISLKKFCKWYQHADWQAIEENMQRLERIAAVFLSFDTNGNTTLERNELAALHAKLVSDKITTLSFESLFEELDKNHTERIELNEFVNWFQQQK